MSDVNNDNQAQIDSLDAAATLGSDYLVIVGSSFGESDELSNLLAHLPQNFPAPLVIAQHFVPNHHTNLVSFLSRRSPLPVISVSSTAKLEGGKIYIVPFNRPVTIKDHTIEVSEVASTDGSQIRPSIDRIFSNAAEVYGDRLIVILLANSGTDGAAGAVDVRNAGGTIIIQDPQTARKTSMPLILPPNIVDFELGVERIGQVLYNLLHGMEVSEQENEPEDILRSILAQVSYRSSIDFRQYKTSTILRRIGRRMTITHSRTMSDYRLYLETHAEEVGELIQALLINVTQFFRDTEAFNYLKTQVLPILFQQARERNRVIRVWSAGCATGEEPYSIAMLLTDMLGNELADWSIKIFATDLDEAAVSFARRGFYSENHLKGVPVEYHDRFFEQVDGGYRISKTLRQMVIFGQQDLSRSAPFPRIDLVMCRNVLIYFTPELQDYVLNQFGFSICPNGFLFLGKAETVRPNQTFFELINKNWKVYHCTGKSVPMARRQHSALDLTIPSQRQDSTVIQVVPALKSGKFLEQENLNVPTDLSQLRRFNELLLRFLPVGVVVVDRAYRLLTSNAAARRLLGLRDFSNEQDFLHSVRGIPYSDMRQAIDTVFREHISVNLPEIELDAGQGGTGRYLAFSMALLQIEAGNPDLATISVYDVTEQVLTRRQLEDVQLEQNQLMNDLSVANRSLNDMNKELVDANEELQVANEELVLTHEELQATIEEFETTNEELQATNEELETNNEELQATNEELQTTNEELRARTSELQELTELLSNERVRLAEIVEVAPLYIVVLRGPNFLIEVFNTRYSRLMDSDYGIQGRPLEEVYELFGEWTVPLLRLAREVYQTEQIRTIEHLRATTPPNVVDNNNAPEFLNYTLIPSHNSAGRVSGVIIYATNEFDVSKPATEPEN